MSKFIVQGTNKHTGKLQESIVHGTYKQAYTDAIDFLESEQYSTIIILRDSEGEDYIDNAGKFFLHRIVKP